MPELGFDDNEKRASSSLDDREKAIVSEAIVEASDNASDKAVIIEKAEQVALEVCSCIHIS
jgi:hypothetical protein